MPIVTLRRNTTPLQQSVVANVDTVLPFLFVDAPGVSGYYNYNLYIDMGYPSGPFPSATYRIIVAVIAKK